ncbi:FadR/GntR family transcriptional regulator [Bosea lathyri]|uniref:Transcriptional regulator, GntR family n=1 Tax=Bosea lathyri TaxID=1036778 RepID=A0A1H6D8C3_9HYPH|nr:FadR/GntR family transcriptional regulator [Bosea lathyri]SEG81133.1 transcriptional regulator, GntR family [Bosea lathyri]
MTTEIEITRLGESGGKGFEKVFAFLRERLLAGSLRPGDRLIPERDLAAQLGVSRPILREALRALTVLGVVEIRDRIGTVVRRPDVSVLNDFFTFALAQQADIIDDVMQARIAIECQAIRLAAERATVADLEILQRALARIVETIEDPEAGGIADFEFHRAVVAAGKSETLNVLYQSMSGILQRSHRGRRDLLEVFDTMKSYLIDDHRRIFDAIVARDPEHAERVLRDHFAIGDDFRRRAAIGEGVRRTASP